MAVSKLMVVSLRKFPQHAGPALAYFENIWPELPPGIIRAAMRSSLSTNSVLPQWYLLAMEGRIIGCSGLAPAGFFHDGEQFPWFFGPRLDAAHRYCAYGRLFLDKARKDCLAFGFPVLYAAAPEEGYYEYHGFTRTGAGRFPWGEESVLYECVIQPPA